MSGVTPEKGSNSMSTLRGVRAPSQRAVSCGRPRHLVTALLVVVSALACRGEELLGPGAVLRLASITERMAATPDLWQTGTFEYDSGDRLVRYEFSHNGFGDPRVTVYTDYQYNGTRLSGSEVFVRAGDNFVRASVYRNTYDESGRLLDVTVESVDEVTGSVEVGVWRHSYGELDRLVEVRHGHEHRWVFGYDASGNLVTEESYLDDRSGTGLQLTTVFSYTHDTFRNPFTALPLHAGPILIHARWPSLSPANVAAWDVRAARGHEIVSWGTADMEYNEDGYPIRRIQTLVNAANPAEETTVIISEYAYVRR